MLSIRCRGTPRSLAIFEIAPKPRCVLKSSFIVRTMSNEICPGIVPWNFLSRWFIEREAHSMFSGQRLSVGSPFRCLH